MTFRSTILSSTARTWNWDEATGLSDPSLELLPLSASNTLCKRTPPSLPISKFAPPKTPLFSLFSPLKPQPTYSHGRQLPTYKRAKNSRPKKRMNQMFAALGHVLSDGLTTLQISEEGLQFEIWNLGGSRFFGMGCSYRGKSVGKSFFAQLPTRRSSLLFHIRALPQYCCYLQTLNNQLTIIVSSSIRPIAGQRDGTCAAW